MQRFIGSFAVVVLQKCHLSDLVARHHWPMYSKLFVVAGGIVRNRAWVIGDSIAAIGANGPQQLFYLTGDNIDNTLGILQSMSPMVSTMVHSTGYPGYERSGPVRYSSSSMAPLRNVWLENATNAWKDLSHLWVVDSDVLPAPDVLDKLLAHNKPVVGAWVPGCTPCESWDKAEGQAMRSGKEHKHPGLFKATMLGGCYLIRRDAIDAGLRWAPHAQGEDGGFGDSARRLGIELWADRSAECEHRMTKP